MPQVVKYTVKCSVCEKEFVDKALAKAEEKARSCEETHDVVYVPLLRSDIQSLLAFIVSKDEKFLTLSMIRTLRSYRSLK